MTEQDEIIEELFTRIVAGTDERIANPKCKNITYSFSKEHSWETIRAVCAKLADYYEERGYIFRLNTNPYHVGVKAKVHLTMNDRFFR